MLNFDLHGETALVTGASRGIGRALALGLARAGADVVVAARDESALAQIAAEIEALGRVGHAVAMDVREIASIDAAMDTIAHAGVHPTILVNNAGVENVRPAVDVDEALWETIVGTNLRGAFFVARAFARAAMLAGRGGTIINVCSLTSERGVATAVPYTASKTGLLGITRALAAEWAPHGIRVNGIGPGYFHTDLTEVFYANEGWREAMLAKIPLGRFGALEDLVGPTVFLASEASRYMTGQVLYVDGGTLAAM